MGGVSSAILTREPSFHGRTANVLRGRVSLENNGGFVQMAANLAKDGKWVMEINSGTVQMADNKIIVLAD